MIVIISSTMMDDDFTYSFPSPCLYPGGYGVPGMQSLPVVARLELHGDSDVDLHLPLSSFVTVPDKTLTIDYCIKWWYAYYYVLIYYYTTTTITNTMEN